MISYLKQTALSRIHTLGSEEGNSGTIGTCTTSTANTVNVVLGVVGVVVVEDVSNVANIFIRALVFHDTQFGVLVFFF